MRTQSLFVKTLPQENGFLTLLNKSILKTIEIKDSILIGRDPGAQIYLPDFCVSNRHARIEKKSDGFYVRDLRSRNGTFINGSRIIEAKLQDHDRLRVGLTEYIFTAEKDMGISNTFLSSQNASWDQQLKRLPAIAQSPHPVLLLGPSGTGKEILANMIHKLSFRSSGQFLSVNCSALTDTLAESELFGHQKGSFTGAQEDRKGAFEAARGGTLFLDEVGDIPLSMQPKFLRALDNNEIKPVGNDSSITIDVRIVAATNRNLKKLVDEGKFREDLYFRLHILQICPPALIERLEDFDSLIQQLSGPLKVFFAPEAMKLLRQHTWPGNIRELKNVISRASALFPGLLITENEIPDILDLDREPKHSNKVKIIPALARQYLHEYEREAIVERLSYYKGNQRRSAQDLGLAKSTLHDRIRRYNICLNDFKEKSKDSL